MSGSTTPIDRRPLIGISAGEPAGVGPDLCLWLAAHTRWPARIVVAADQAMMRERARRLGLPWRFKPFDPASSQTRARFSLWDHPLPRPVTPGCPDPGNARGILDALDQLSDACQSGILQALVTGPIQKSAIVDAGIPFTGHTEYLADRLGAQRVVMMLVGGGLRVALATTHLPLRAVPQAITIDSLRATLAILERALKEQFGIPQPRILVTGLNPHAGEGGHLGREEIEVITPALEAARAAGIDARGPYPADTLFVPERLEGADAVLAMYHDQGLPVLKMKSFGKGVNVTLGLPIIRTSVDHGTALDRAGTGTFDPGSLKCAVKLAIELTHAPAA